MHILYSDLLDMLLPVWKGPGEKCKLYFFLDDMGYLDILLPAVLEGIFGFVEELAVMAAHGQTHHSCPCALLVFFYYCWLC